MRRKDQPGTTNVPHPQRPLRLLVCTANLGNAAPDADSMAAWIPPDGFLLLDQQQPHNRVIEETDHEHDEPEQQQEEEELADTVTNTATQQYQIKYPLRWDPRTATEQSSNVDGDVISAALSHQFDLIVIGLQEATFDPPPPPPPELEGGADDLSSNKNNSIRIRVPMVKPLRKFQTLRTAKDFSQRSTSEVEDSITINTCSNAADAASTSGPHAAGSTSPSPSTVPSPDSSLPHKATRLITGQRWLTICQEPTQGWEDGTHLLHALLQGRLPSYSRLVSYQRGQMRLIVMGRTSQSTNNSTDPPLPLQVLRTAAQNTGRAGLANKGGIVTEILVNHTTRLSFVSCHLEAHEGATKRTVRCQTMGDILLGTAGGPKATKPSNIFTAALESNNHNATENNTPMDNSSQHSIRHTLHLSSPSRNAVDVSLTSHYSFVLGDLNFRTDLTLQNDNVNNGIYADQDEAHKEAVQKMVHDKDWDGLNQADELHHVLRQKACLVGYQTMLCNFPPTFKMERQSGYVYMDKRRPSYTDRVLFKSGHQLEQGLQPLLYEPIDTFASSDHKPVRAAFTLDLNPRFRIRPRTVRTQSIRRLQPPGDEVAKNVPAGRRLSCIFGPCLGRQDANHADENRSLASNNPNVVDLGHGQGLGLKGADELQLFVSKINIVLSKSESISATTAAAAAALGTPLAPNPYLLLMTQPEEAIRQSAWKRSRRLKRLLHYITGSPLLDKGRVRNGWPCSSTKTATYTANWNEEEIRCHVSTHASNGASIDLSGALLFLTVMDQGATEDSIVGSFAFNLANLMKQSTEHKNVLFGHRNVRQSAFSGIRQPASTHQTAPRSRQGKSVFSTMFGGRSSDFLTSADPRQESEEYEDDPFTTVEINEALLKGGVEVGQISCTIEAWWVDEATANAARFSEARRPDSRSGRTGRQSDAAFRRTIVQTPPTTG